MKFISAGHCADRKSPNFDSGAEGINKRLECDETIKVRDRVIAIIKEKGYTDIIQDANNESLKEYLNRAKTGNGSMVCEFHFNAFNFKTSGTEVLVADNPSINSSNCAKEMADVTASILGIPNRGVKTEAESHRGKLGLMREMGIVVLVEVCFIDSATDMAAYDTHFEALCQAYADILIKYDNLIK
mgnify:CR=1 FL=1